MSGLRGRCWLIVLAVIGSQIRAETVCIVDPEGDGWRCGSPEEIAPVRPGRAQRSDAARSLPPPMLIDPARLPRVEYEAAVAAGMMSGNQRSTQTDSTSAAAVSTAAPAASSGAPPPLRARPPAAAPARPTESRPNPAQTAALVNPPTPDRAAQAGSASQPGTSGAAQSATAGGPLGSAEVTPAATNAAPAPLPTPSTDHASPSVAEPPASSPARTASTESSAAATNAVITPTKRTSPASVATANESAPDPAGRAAPIARPTQLALRQPHSIAAWGDREYTLQLVAATSNSGFAQFATEAGLTGADLFVIRLVQPEGDWWLLCSGRYPDLESARRALDSLPLAARSKGAWPRRLGPLKKDSRT